MLICYPRTSTIEQEAGLLPRRRDVSARGCGEGFVEQVSSVQRREGISKAGGGGGIQRQRCERQSKG